MKQNDRALPMRSVAARIGVSLLNLLTPGLGLFRVGRIREGLGWATASLLTLAVLWLAAATLPTLSGDYFRPLAAILILLGALWLIGPIVATWRFSAQKQPSMRWWSRWYGLVGIAASFMVGSNVLLEGFRGVYRPFYLPSEAMHPTMLVGERFVADMRTGRQTLLRGDIILLRVRDAIYVKRVVGLPGDRVSMRDGVPVINGASAAQRVAGTLLVNEFGEAVPARIVVETLPGASSGFRTLGMGSSRTDEMAELVVPAGRLFVLGDNRDRSADSRVSRAEGGVELPPVGDVIGRPLFKTWAADWGWLGTPLAQSTQH